MASQGREVSLGREWIFEACSDVQSIRPQKRSSCRDEPAGARYAIGASETGRSLLEANRPLAGCFPAEPASVSSGNVISTQDSHKRNHWTTAANATMGHRSMPQKIPRCVGVNRPFGSGEHGHQPESSLARMAHLAPEYWPTFWPELTTGHRRIRRKDRNVRDRRPADLMARGTPLHSWSRHATSRSRYRSWSSSRDDVGGAATTVPFPFNSEEGTGTARPCRQL